MWTHEDWPPAFITDDARYVWLLMDPCAIQHADRHCPAGEIVAVRDDRALAPDELVPLLERYPDDRWRAMTPAESFDPWKATSTAWFAVCPTCSAAGGAVFGHAHAELRIFHLRTATPVATRRVRQRRPLAPGTLPPEERSRCGQIYVAMDVEVVLCRYAITEPGPDGGSVAAFEPHVFIVPELRRLAP